MESGVQLTSILAGARQRVLALFAFVFLAMLGWPGLDGATGQEKPAATERQTSAKAEDADEKAEANGEKDDEDDEDEDDEEAEERERRERWPLDRIRGAFHEFHIAEMELVCGDCHEAPIDPGPRDDLAFSKRPDHEACDSCHEQFEALEEGEAKEEEKEVATATSETRNEEPPAPPSFVCKMCHLDDEETLGTFPSGALNLTGFSHAQHVDKRARLNPEHGLREDCAFCHVDADNTALDRPRHQQCGACHAGDEAAEPNLEDADELEQCQGCHSLERMDANIAPPAPAPHGDAHGKVMAATSGSTNGKVAEWFPHEPRAGAPGRPYRDILPFPHEGHLKGKNGEAVACATCHAAADSSEDITKPTPRPTMRECGECHDKPALVGAEKQTSNCQTCHAYVSETLRPRKGDPVSAPLTHSERFRIHHEEQGWDPERKCSVCHVGTRDALDDGCSGCHASMQPRSHMSPRFNEMPHGRLAAFDRESCATCHTGDFCARCHNRPPRSHQPLAAFAGALGGSHRILASINLRSCFACHTFEADCSRCHVRTVP